jgi:hypothetical protein
VGILSQLVDILQVVGNFSFPVPEHKWWASGHFATIGVGILSQWVGILQVVGNLQR